MCESEIQGDFVTGFGDRVRFGGKDSLAVRKFILRRIRLDDELPPRKGLRDRVRVSVLARFGK